MVHVWGILLCVERLYKREVYPGEARVNGDGLIRPLPCFLRRWRVEGCERERPSVRVLLSSPPSASQRGSCLCPKTTLLRLPG